MINRVIIRSKVVQVAYSYFITKEKTIAEAEKELHHSLAKSYELYHALLQLMVELTDLQAQRIDAARNKYLPTEEDLHPNMRFVENQFIKTLRNNADFVEFRKEKPFLWDAAAPDFLRRTLDAIVASDTYREYMNGPFNDENIDSELWRVLFKTIIAPSDDLTETLENISLYWNEDLNTEATFVLKTIADVGLVGFPNAGKSSLTGALTNARPKCAPYPFTTKNPSVGVIEYDDYARVFLADIPGLIEGASENRGLGHRFLRHVERCRLLLFIIDMAGTDGRKPADDYAALLDELKNFNPALLEKPRLVAANKMDCEPSAKNLAAVRRRHKDAEICRISCLAGTGLDALKTRIRELVLPA